MEFNRKDYVYGKLQEHYKAIEDKYEIFGLFLQGSQNYGLDIYTEEYMSDVDTKAIILPSLEDIVEGRRLVSTKVEMPDNSLIDVKDIRAMCEQWEKQNPSYLEILFTEFFIINPKYEWFFQVLKGIRKDIAAINNYSLHRSIFGMAMEKHKALKHPYPASLDMIEKYGYSTKQFLHIHRLHDMQQQLIEGKPYGECLIPRESSDWYKLVRFGYFHVDVAEMAAADTCELITDYYKSLDKQENDEEKVEKLRLWKSSMIKERLIEEIMNEESSKYI